jgi:predicted GH43/DUF377 family glycosyl hydrolase
MPITFAPEYIMFVFIIIIAIGVICYLIFKSVHQQKKNGHAEHKIKRHHANPIISPRPHREWEANGTFNPAAIKDDEGCVHLLYRAIGDNGLSNIGHASSRDGMNFDQRSSFPVYQPSIEEKKPTGQKPSGPKEYNPTLYTSGGGWGGHEDPRAVRIGDRVYMTYTAFQGWDSVRIALTSIALKDLKKEQWDWKKPKMISPPGEVHKNWVLFPEKINGKFAILHGVSPDVLVDYVDNIDNPYPGKYINSKPPKGGRSEHWDNWVRGAGPPPIRTNLGWLLLYHAMDKKNPNKYKLGAMILDIDDPTKILYRSPQPILEPDMHYENDGKPGVVYASGAIIRDKQLTVYYGGGDKHVCMAETPLDELLQWMVKYGKV